MIRTVYQLHFKTADERGFKLTRAVLMNLGYGEPDMVSSVIDSKSSIELFDERKAKLEGVKKLFSRLGLAGVNVRQYRLAPKDWLTRWKTQWKPAALTKRLDVVPVWYKNKYKPRDGRGYILMDTLLSFGTGLHETTRFMAQFIEDSRGRFRSFLDIGTGTGILAMVAQKNGADNVWGIDIEPLSVQAARDNMKANKLSFKVRRADIKNYRSREKFDLVAANLITEDLMQYGRKITGFVKEGGLLAVSGISLENLSKLRKAFSSLPLRCCKISKGKQWLGILYQKRADSLIKHRGNGTFL